MAKLSLEKAASEKCNKRGIRWSDNCELCNRRAVVCSAETVCKFSKPFVFGYRWYFRSSLTADNLIIALPVCHGHLVGLGTSSQPCYDVSCTDSEQWLLAVTVQNLHQGKIIKQVKQIMKNTVSERTKTKASPIPH